MKVSLSFEEWCKTNATKNLQHIGITFLFLDDMGSLYDGYQAYLKEQEEVGEEKWLYVHSNGNTSTDKKILTCFGGFVHTHGRCCYSHAKYKIRLENI